jgi:hypothetical protein
MVDQWLRERRKSKVLGGNSDALLPTDPLKTKDATGFIEFLKSLENRKESDVNLFV